MALFESLSDAYCRRDEVWAIGKHGTIVHSPDGKTWQTQTSNAGNADLLAIHGDAQGRLWAVGSGGTIVHSADGKTWQTQTSNASVHGPVGDNLNRESFIVSCQRLVTASSYDDPSRWTGRRGQDDLGRQDRALVC
jgi:trehalose-6-phosphatase